MSEPSLDAALRDMQPTEIAAGIRANLREAKEAGRIPATTKISVRVQSGSMYRAVNVVLTSPGVVSLRTQPELLRPAAWTGRAHELASAIRQCVAPFLPWEDGRYRFINIRFGALSAPDGHPEAG